MDLLSKVVTPLPGHFEDNNGMYRYHKKVEVEARGSWDHVVDGASLATRCPLSNRRKEAQLACRGYPDNLMFLCCVNVQSHALLKDVHPARTTLVCSTFYTKFRSFFNSGVSVVAAVALLLLVLPVAGSEAGNWVAPFFLFDIEFIYNLHLIQCRCQTIWGMHGITGRQNIQMLRIASREW